MPRSANRQTLVRRGGTAAASKPEPRFRQSERYGTRAFQWRHFLRSQAGRDTSPRSLSVTRSALTARDAAASPSPASPQFTCGDRLRRKRETCGSEHGAGRQICSIAKRSRKATCSFFSTAAAEAALPSGSSRTSLSATLTTPFCVAWTTEPCCPFAAPWS